MKNNQPYTLLYDALIFLAKASKKIAIAFMLTPSFCYADTIPTNNTSLTMSFDKRGVPNSITIWNALSGGESPANPQLLGRNILVCQSDSDSTYGKCRTTPVWPNWAEAWQINKIITLKFCKNGGECKDLKLDAYHTTDVGNIIAPYFAYALSNSNGNKFTYSLSQSELSQLTAGTWKATLKQALYQWDPKKYLTTWTANITLT
ncbi:CfaE/CblD family pilus tip adhesin, partial [Pantoea ananatis]|uniref:CfaE/CblD family pilus tip adhesin n=1 Tax=Pantoea ananas TaxID=553 RepID=UPI002402CA49